MIEPEPNEDETTKWQSIRERLKDGDASAQREIFEQYSSQLVRLAEKNIHPGLNRRFDGDDVVQSVFRTFFRRQQQGKLTIQESEELWRLLVTITICKTRSHARKHRAQRRDVQSEQNLDDLKNPIPDSKASDQDLLALCEEIDLVMNGLPEPSAEILKGRLEGKSKTEIADELNLTRQTIHRILKLVQERLTLRFDSVFSGKTDK